MSLRDFGINLLIILILIEGLTLIISLIPAILIIRGTADNPDPERIVDMMQWLVNFLWAQIIAIPLSLAIAFLKEGLNIRDNGRW